jgi:predicted MFS family arabinose efflux permease
MTTADGTRTVRARTAALLSPLTLANYRRLWAADMISLLGDWAGRLALAVVVHDRTGSPAWAAAVTAVSLAGFVGIGQALATLADRYGRIAVMIVADLVRAACFAAMLLSVPVGVLLLLAFVAGLASPPFEAARSAALPDLVPEDRYGPAVALAGISVQASLVLGYALGGALLQVVEPKVALGVNAASFLISALLVWTLRSTPASAPATKPTTVGSSLHAGFRNLVDDRVLRRAVLLLGVTSFLGIVPEALVVPYGDLIGFSDSSIGLLAAAVPVGTIIGVVCIPSGGEAGRLLRAASVCAVVAASLAAPLLWLEVDGALAIVAFACAGGIFAVGVPTNVLLGTRLSRDNRASAMGIALGVVMGTQALGAVLGGVVASSAGIGEVAGGALALAAVWCAWAALSSPHYERDPAGTGSGSAAQPAEGASASERVGSPA